MSTPHVHPANWYPDPSGAQFLRYWDGTAWTAHTRPMPQVAAPSGAHTTAVATMHQPAAPMVLYPQTSGVAAPIGVWRGPIDSRPFVPDMFAAIRVCVQKYASFDGRAGRPEFWYAQLAMVLAVIAALFVIWIPIMGWLAMLTLWLLGLAAIVPSLAVTVRRLRDAGFHWAWIFISLAPFGSIALLIFCAQQSKHP
ncbi:DUF805 domain-containing protein [Microbacterium sp.]|uniref:DUF805 domain-containing protein n=1 Tax=Microbacterium sp. TaxID=51671 RepID=UPI0026147768|nr:DUF805 domain-containing protein [Microbacterium sp.]